MVVRIVSTSGGIFVDELTTFGYFVEVRAFTDIGTSVGFTLHAVDTGVENVTVFVVSIVAGWLAVTVE